MAGAGGRDGGEVAVGAPELLLGVGGEGGVESVTPEGGLGDVLFVVDSSPDGVAGHAVGVGEVEFGDTDDVHDGLACACIVVGVGEVEGEVGVDGDGDHGLGGGGAGDEVGGGGLGVLEFDAGGDAGEAEEPGEGFEGEGGFEEDIVGGGDDHVVEEGEAFQALGAFGDQSVW